MFRKVLIANRGEIAIRVMRGCRELGISPVAVYSEADRNALHVQMADEAHLIGPPPATESYLVIDRIIEAALTSGAEAIHPGYGFLAENAQLAQACEQQGLVFIGPPSAAIRLMGDKTAARRAMQAAGVPVVPGIDRFLQDDGEARQVIETMGYPVMIKAALGGGGRGMRLVPHESLLVEALRAARSEARSAFGDAAIYIEKYVSNPRHIEVQVLADADGRVIHLGERECSIQRRHQKVVEESPSPLVTEELRGRMGEAAVRAAQAANYRNAGTVEFLVDATGNFYFLEMNTRLQVEHPVTEMVTGIDLVQAQLRIADGEPLRYRQEDIVLRGAALECRVYAEDPAHNFRPSPGKITVLQPPAGPWVRDERGVFAGGDVSPFYDPMISKLVVWGETRQEAIARMRRALGEYVIGGIRTTIPFHQWLMDDEDFLAGHLDTGFIERRYRPHTVLPDQLMQDVALIAAALDQWQAIRQTAVTPKSESRGDAVNPWKLVGRIDLMRRRG
ncbi:MAG TPA: acetyl-CoA carboxylase biotin carboxylase subunit [Candidatus Tectomicrobia bacterium]|nr:acetyl-CoA carboxylase biotin carboxylase subunit [Candidatus Tectomicrobia bacterium]